MNYQAQDFSSLKGLPGLSDQLLENHFTLYQGYVANTNKDLEKLSQMLDEGKQTENEYMELKRRLGWEFDGMRLHEYYFGNLTLNGSSLDENSALAQKLKEDFGSVENWEKDFRATAAMRGIGWAILYADTQQKKLINFWINEHDAGHLAGGEPILVLDVFEHAFMLDYGTKKAEYIEAVMKDINWEVAEKRYAQAQKEPQRQ